MITYKKWTREYGSKRTLCDGWYLFGIVPLYARKWEVLK